MMMIREFRNDIINVSIFFVTTRRSLDERLTRTRMRVRLVSFLHRRVKPGRRTLDERRREGVLNETRPGGRNAPGDARAVGRGKNQREARRR